MPDYDRETDPRWLMLDAPTRLTELPGGGYRIEKAGVVGVGATVEEAAADLGDKFAVALTRPPLDG